MIDYWIIIKVLSWAYFALVKKSRPSGYYYDYTLALINWAEGLYGRILTKVVSTDGTQWGPLHMPSQDSPYRPT